jgi:hypothetical protein
LLAHRRQRQAAKLMERLGIAEQLKDKTVEGLRVAEVVAKGERLIDRDDRPSAALDS